MAGKNVTDKLAEQVEGSPPWLTHVAAAATVIVTAVNGTFGVLGSAIGGERFFRNSSLPFYFALAATGVALFCVGRAYLEGADAARRGHRNLWSLFALAALLLAVILGSAAIARAGAADHGPVIDAEVSSLGELSGSASATGLSGDQRFQVAVSGIPANGASVPIFSGAVGPNPEGVATLALDVALDPRRYDRVSVEAWLPGIFPWDRQRAGCADPPSLFGAAQSCLLLPVSGSAAPLVSVEFGGEGANRSVIGSVVALPDRGEILFVLVRDGAGDDPLFETTINGEGRTVTVPLDITVGQEYRSVCVFGVLMESNVESLPEACPPEEPRSGWAWLRTAATDDAPPPSPALVPDSSVTPGSWPPSPSPST